MKLGNKELAIPLIQGGMGVGISLGGLAGAVAKCGGMGVISTAGPGYRVENFWADTETANQTSLRAEILKAKEIAKGCGLVAINAMVATTNYAQSIKTSIEAGIDCIISGAGLPMDLPSLVKGTDVIIAPIISSGRAAQTICRVWDKRHSTAPDFIVVEGSEAGGHLGFAKDDLLNSTTKPLDDIVPEVLQAIIPFEEKYGKKIPVFAAGGIYTSADVLKFIKMGATGVQIGTRFVATHECDASDGYKQIYLDAKKEDIQIVPSPAGLPGRALNTPLIQKVKSGTRIPPTHCASCLHPCKPAETPYCISNALISAVEGDYEKGLFFCGSNVWRIDKIVSVKELIDELLTDWRASK